MPNFGFAGKELCELTLRATNCFQRMLNWFLTTFRRKGMTKQKFYCLANVCFYDHTGKQTMGALEAVERPQRPGASQWCDANVFASRLNGPGEEKPGNNTSLLLRRTIRRLARVSECCCFCSCCSSFLFFLLFSCGWICSGSGFRSCRPECLLGLILLLFVVLVVVFVLLQFFVFVVFVVVVLDSTSLLYRYYSRIVQKK